MGVRGKHRATAQREMGQGWPCACPGSHPAGRQRHLLSPVSLSCCPPISAVGLSSQMQVAAWIRAERARLGEPRGHLTLGATWAKQIHETHWTWNEVWALQCQR